MLTGSVVSYKERGPFGRNSYRGNTTGYLVRDLIETFNPRVLVDPAKGSDTTGDVVRALNSQGYRISYFGYDLSAGFAVPLMRFKPVCRPQKFLPPA